MKAVRAVVECATCRKVIRGEPVRTEAVSALEAEDVTEILLRAVAGLVRAHGPDLLCPNCGASIISCGTKVFLAYDECNTD